MANLRRSLNQVTSLLDAYSPTRSEVSEVAMVSEGGWTEGNSYTQEDPGLPDCQPVVERGALSVSAETPRRTRRGHSPAPKFPPSYNYHVSTGPAGRHGVSHWRGGMGSTWHCDIPDVTVPKKPDLRWMEEDLGEALAHLFCNKVPDTLEVGGPRVDPPAESNTAIGDRKPMEYRGVYYIPAGYSVSQFSNRGSKGHKLSKFVAGKKFTDYRIGPGGLPTPTVRLICRDKTLNRLFRAEILPDSSAAADLISLKAAKRWGLTITKWDLPKVTLKDASGNCM